VVPSDAARSGPKDDVAARKVLDRPPASGSPRNQHDEALHCCHDASPVVGSFGRCFAGGQGEVPPSAGNGQFSGGAERSELPSRRPDAALECSESGEQGRQVQSPKDWPFFLVEQISGVFVEAK